MLPSKDITNCSLGDAKPPRQFSLKVVSGGIQIANCAHFACSKNMRRMVLPEQSNASSWRWCPSLFDHIYQIVFLCSEKQVVWITAGRIIAVMANKQIMRHLFSVMQAICNPVSALIGSIYPKKAIVPLPWLLFSNPLPTFFL